MGRWSRGRMVTVARRAYAGRTMRIPLAAALVVLGAVAAPSLRAQIIELSFDTETRFHDDAVDTNQYFRLPEDSTAHFDLRFNPERPRDGGDFIHIRMNGGDGSLVFDETRALDWVIRDDHWFSLTFTNQRSTGPVEHWFYEALVLEMRLTDGWMHEDGYFVPPEVDIDTFSQLYVSGYSPMIQYVPPGYAGYFGFGPPTSNVTFAVVPIPEPSTYAGGVLLLLAAAAGWRSRRRMERASIG